MTLQPNAPARRARWAALGALVLALLAARPAAAQSADRDGPAARRLRELVAAVASGDRGRVRAYVREAYAPELRARIDEESVVQFYARLHARSRGLAVDSLRATPTEAAARLRARLTGLWEELSVRVEPAPPHRIVAGASFRVVPPAHPLARAGARDADRVREIDRVARGLAAADAFSGVVLVARGDSILYLRGFGRADRARGVAVAPETRFQSASLTKPFVSVAVARLVERGALSWDDTIGKFLPDFPPAAARSRVRVRHLVTHTSGLRDFACEEKPCPDPARSTDDHLRAAALSQGDSLLYEPGTRNVYTNANFAVLGRLVELLGGEPLHEHVTAHVFRPAGMTETRFFAPDRPPAPLAVGYDRRFGDDGVRLLPEDLGPASASYGSAHAGTYTTARDLFRFARALMTGRLLRPETAALLVAPKPEAGSWGYGLEIYDEGRGLVGHGGSWRGISNGLDLFTRSGYTAIVLSNHTDGRSPLREAVRAILP